MRCVLRNLALALVVPLGMACSSGGDGGMPLYAVGDGAGATPGAAASARANGGDGGTSGTGGGNIGDAQATDGGSIAPDATSAPPSDPCPTLPTPGTAFGRNVVYREWSASATGDGAYFASQAPWRLGFNRLHGNVWIVKFRTEAASYFGRISVGADSTAGMTWISDTPTDATFAVQHKLVTYGTHGDGMIDFVVVKDDADALRIATEPAFASLRSSPQLRGDHCYYVAFENVAGTPANPLTSSYFATAPDDCGALNGTPDCYYLAFDFNHRLHETTQGQVVAGNVIAGLTK